MLGKNTYIGKICLKGELWPGKYYICTWTEMEKRGKMKM